MNKKQREQHAKELCKAALADSMILLMRESLYDAYDRKVADKRLSEFSRYDHLKHIENKLQCLRELADQLNVKISIKGGRQA